MKVQYRSVEKFFLGVVGQVVSRWDSEVGRTSTSPRIFDGCHYAHKLAARLRTAVNGIPEPPA